MATLPLLDPAPRYMSAEELWEIRGTPEFYAEYKRQLSAIAEQDRKSGVADRMPIDWEAIKGWE